MARIRSIKPQFFLNEELAELPAMTRLLFVGLWTQADRAGRLIDRPKRLKAEIFPYDNYDIEKGLKQLSDAGFILRYKANVNATGSVLAPEQPTNELALIQIINFSRHQKIDKVNEKESDFPDPLTLDYYKPNDRLVIDGEGKGKEGNKEGKGEERESTPDNKKKLGKVKASPHLFRDSEFFEKEKFSSALATTQYQDANTDYYHEVILNWSDSNGAQKSDWLATAKNWMARDMTDGKFIAKGFQPRNNGQSNSKNGRPGPGTAQKHSEVNQAFNEFYSKRGQHSNP